MHIAVLLLALLGAAVSTPLTRRQSSSSFSLYAQSPDPALNGRWVAENSSTDYGPTVVILAPQGSQEMKIDGFLLYQPPPLSSGTYFLVNYPARQGGSEFDGWVVGDANSTGFAVPEVVPAQGTIGWSLKNVTKNGQTESLLAEVQESDGKQAKFLICDQVLEPGCAPKQQLFVYYKKKIPAGCKRVQLVASFDSP